MKVFHFILDHRVGGPHMYVNGIARMLAPTVASAIITTGRGEQTTAALLNWRRHSRALYPLEVFLNVVIICWMFRAGRSRASTVFDVHGAANIAPVLAARLLCIPLVWHFHETLASYIGLVKLGKLAVAGTTHKFVAVAKSSMDVFSLGCATLIPGAVDATFWCVSEEERIGRDHGARLRLIMVGNLNPLKGVDLLLDAMEALDVPWELVIVGAELATYKEYAYGLRERARKLINTDRAIRFTGWQSPEAIRKLLADANIFVLPSRSEACPIALLEAMAAECTCVATDVGDVGEIFAAPGTGILAKSVSSDSLLAALEMAVELGSKRRREMGERARANVLNRFSLIKMARRHIEIYQELLGETLPAHHLGDNKL